VEQVGGSTLRYRMTGSEVVRWNRFAFDRHPAHPMLLLTSCYPFGAVERGPWRFVAKAEKVG
jgi:sortase A